MPPQKMTVKIEMREVVVRNICLASDMVFCMARAKAMAPRNPENQSMCWKLVGILFFLPRFRRNDKG